MTAILLDTCAALWLTKGADMTPAGLAAIESAASGGRLWISPVTGWEVAAKISSGKAGAPTLNVPSSDWYASLLASPGVREAVLTGPIAIGSALLPWLHRDPADRFIIATAVQLGAAVVTRDARILDYAAAGVVEVIPC